MSITEEQIKECFEKHYKAIKDLELHKIPASEYDADPGKDYIKRFKGLVVPLGVKYIWRLRLGLKREVLAFYRCLNELGITKVQDQGAEAPVECFSEEL